MTETQRYYWFHCVPIAAGVFLVIVSIIGAMCLSMGWLNENYPEWGDYVEVYFWLTIIGVFVIFASCLLIANIADSICEKKKGKKDD